MKKILLGVVAIVVAIVAVGPYLVGKKIQSSMDELVESLNEAPGYTASWESYSRSWKESDAVLLINFEFASPSGEGTESIDVPVQIGTEHGPLLMQNGFKPGWFDMQVRLTDEADTLVRETLVIDGEAPFYLLTASMDLLQKTAIEDRSLAFSFEEDGESIVVGEYTGAGTLHASQTLNYSMALPQVSGVIDASTFNLAAGTAEFSSDLSRAIELGLSPSTAKIVFPNFSVPEESISIEQLQMNSVVSLDDDNEFFSMNVDFELDKLVASDQQVNKLLMRLTYDRISVAFMQGYQDAIDQNPDANFDEQAVEVLTNLVYEELLAYSPKIAIDELSFEHNTGKFDANFMVTIDGDAIVEAGLNGENPMALIPFVKMDSKVVSDKALAEFIATEYMTQQMQDQMAATGEQATAEDIAAMVDEQVPGMLQMLEAQNIFVSEDDSYVTSMEFNQGQASLNGQPMPLPF